MTRENKTLPAHRRESKFSWKKVLAALGVFTLIAVIAVGGVFGHSMYQAGKVNQPQTSATVKTPVKKTATPTPKKAAGWIPLVMDRASLQVVPGYLYESSEGAGTSLSTQTAAKYLAHLREVTEGQTTELKDPPTADSTTQVKPLNS